MKYVHEQKHFSHHHGLVPLVLDEGEELNCNGCETKIEEPFHGCISCNYFLHESCLNTPRFLQHPSHPHTLTLLPTPTYRGGVFTCDACRTHGKSFSLSCAECKFDLHLHCASLPLTLRVPGKHDYGHDRNHDLKLIFEFRAGATWTCSTCNRKVDPKLWRYYCAGCDYGVDLDCARLPETDWGGGGGGGQKNQNVGDHLCSSCRKCC